MARLSARRILHSLLEVGPKAFLGSAWRKLTGRLRGSGTGVHDSMWAKEGTPRVHPFDAQYGTDTSGILSGESLSSGSRNDVWNTAYYGVSPSVFDQIFDALDLPWREFTFVDLGSGKGRALLIASRYPLRAIVGVELVAALSEVARANLRGFSAPWQLCRAIEARTGDAALFAYPSGPLIVFLYHPFLSPVLKRCLKNLARSLAGEPREAYVVYVNPILEDLLERVPKMKKLWERTFFYSEGDVLADQLGGTADRVAVWQYLL